MHTPQYQTTFISLLTISYLPIITFLIFAYIKFLTKPLLTRWKTLTGMIIERNRRRRSNIALLVAVLGLLFAAWQYFNAEQAKKEAQDSEAKAIEKTLAAIISDSLARVSRDSALLQKNIANEKTTEADLAATEADRQKVAALWLIKIQKRLCPNLKSLPNKPLLF